MFTAIVLMCTADLWCYTIVQERGFYTSEKQCITGINELLNSEEFDPMYRFFEEGYTFDVYSSECVEWKSSEPT
jgi:hypothetical protein